MNVFVVVPNWNGADYIRDCLHSLQKQTTSSTVVVVDNGSIDDSVAIVKKDFPLVIVIELPQNTGFTGGVNTGIEYALQKNADAIALFNNDAIADKDWLKHLTNTLADNSIGIATCKFVTQDKKHIDSTGDLYTTWGLPYPRGRNTSVQESSNTVELVFGASGGASLYRASMLKQIGLFDQKFFAYLEDVDISWRAQLAGWKVAYAPSAVAYHKIGGTSGKIHGFGTYHYLKNLPMLFWKNVPWRYVPHIFPRLFLAYWTIMLKSIFTGKAWPALKGHTAWLKNMPHTFRQRRRIQASKTVSNDYIWSILTHDLPPNARNLRKLRHIASLGRIKP